MFVIVIEIVIEDVLSWYNGNKSTFVRTIFFKIIFKKTSRYWDKKHIVGPGEFIPPENSISKQKKLG